ncbi:MAG: class I SAM-dependent methyltransferase [Micropepsaceae bacterium]
MNAEEPFLYDEIVYPTPVVAQMATERMASAAVLHGWTPPDPATSAVLEIGCGDGLNLLGMAEVAPRARHVGFDLSPVTIERGKRLAAAAGVTNAELTAGDILTWPRNGEAFGYISCHGVYSWVPGHVRAGLLDLICARLAPGGMAYVSFDCLPAASAKREIQEFLRRETADIADPMARVAAAMSLIRLLARNKRPNSRLRPELDTLMSEIDKYDPNYFFHDWLADHYAPVSLHAFAAAADRAGLAVAGDAGLADLYLDDLDADGRAYVEQAGADWAERGFRRDTLRGNQMFRRVLLVRKDAPPPRTTSLDGLSFAFFGERRVEGARVRYASDHDAFMIAADGREQAALDLLADGSAAERSFDEIAGRTGDAAFAAGLMKRAAALPILTAHATPAPYTLKPGAKPQASGLVLAMLEHGDWVITRRHARLTLASAPTRQFLKLCDGTRDRNMLADEMRRVTGANVPPAGIDAVISDLAKRRVMIG